MATARRFTLQEVADMLDDDTEVDEELSDDNEELVGDFLDDSGKQTLLSEVSAQYDDDEYKVSDRNLDACYRDSFALNINYSYLSLW